MEHKTRKALLAVGDSIEVLVRELERVTDEPNADQISADETREVLHDLSTAVMYLQTAQLWIYRATGTAGP